MSHHPLQPRSALQYLPTSFRALHPLASFSTPSFAWRLVFSSVQESSPRRQSRHLLPREPRLRTRLRPFCRLVFQRPLTPRLNRSQRINLALLRGALIFLLQILRPHCDLTAGVQEDLDETYHLRQRRLPRCHNHAHRPVEVRIPL